MADFKTVGNLATKATDTAANATKNAKVIQFDQAKSALNKAADTATSTAKSGQVIQFDQAKSSLKDLRNDVNQINSIGKEDSYMDGMDVSETHNPGDKVAPGKVVNKDGEVEDSATKQVLGAAAKAAITYFTAGGGSAVSTAAGTTAKTAAGTAAKEVGSTAAKEVGKEAGKAAAKGAGKAAAKGAGKAATTAVKGAKTAASNASKNGLMDAAGNLISSNDMARDAIGKASELIGKATGETAEALDKIPGMKQANEHYFVDAAQSVNSVFDAFGNLLNGDLGQMFDNLGKTLKSGAKFTGKTLVLTIALGIASTVLTIILLFLPLWATIIPAVHFLDILSDKVSKSEEVYSTSAYSSMYGASLYWSEMVKAVADEVPDFNNLSNGRKVVIVAAATAIDTNYTDGGRPTDSAASGITGGVDSNGLVEWIFWNVTGSDPGNIDVTSLSSNSNFSSISQDALKPGDLGVSGDTVGIYLGDNNWIYVDKTVGVIRGQYNGFTEFYTYKEIDTIAVNAGGGGAGGQGYYYGEGPSGEFRDRLIGWAEILHGMNIPYCNVGSYNVSYSLDVNQAGFWTVVPGKTLDPTATNRKNLKGLDCGGFVSYVYFLTTGGKWKGNLNYYLYGTPQAGFERITKDQVKKGDVAIMPGSHVMMVDHVEPDGKLYVYEMSGCAEHDYVINGIPIHYKGSTSVGTGCNGGFCQTHECEYYTYVGEE